MLTIKGYSAISLFLGKSGIYVFNSVQYLCQFTSLDFYIIPGTFPYLPDAFPYLPDAFPYLPDAFSYLPDAFSYLPDAFPYLPGGKFTPRSHPVKFLKI